jgi:hypothetical protein
MAAPDSAAAMESDESLGPELLRAAAMGEEATVNELLEKRADVTYFDPSTGGCACCSRVSARTAHDTPTK